MAFSSEVTTPLLREHQRRFCHLNFASTRPVFWAYTVLFLGLHRAVSFCQDVHLKIGPAPSDVR